MWALIAALALAGVLWLGAALGLTAQASPIITIPAEVDFSRTLRAWDGFGFNYVEAAQTRDYAAWAQDYGGFSLLHKDQKAEIAQLVFGQNGLDVDILNLFLDPWRQQHRGGDFDQETTTHNMVEFALRGAALRRAQGRELAVMTTHYRPPPWATMQWAIGGRDLDPKRMGDTIAYMLEWVEYLRGLGLDVRYISPYNGAEDSYRWTVDGGKQRLERFDYNAYWPPETIRVTEGRYELTPGYYFYKQMTAAGHAGMEVAYTEATNAQVHVSGFARGASEHPDAFVVSSAIAIWSLPIRVEVRGTEATEFRAFRTSEDDKEQFAELGTYPVVDGAIIYDPPTGTTTTFIAVE